MLGVKTSIETKLRILNIMLWICVVLITVISRSLYSLQGFACYNIEFVV